MFDVCVIGHVTKDIIRINGEAEKRMPGGAAYYTSMALKSFGVNVAVITKVSTDDQDHLLSELRRSGIAVFCKESEETTIFENIYRSEDKAVRTQKVKAVASPFSPVDLEHIRAAAFHVGPLTNRDVSPGFLDEVSRRGRLVSLDVQGLIREVRDGEIIEKDWQEKEKGLAYIDILKADKNEARILSKEDNLEKAAVELSRFGPKEVIITLADEGSLIFSNGKFYRIPAFPARKMIDSTGCGDTYIAGYLYQRLHSSNIEKAGRLAASIATLKLEVFGPFKSPCTRRD
jgi:sugar/nucleoside kinase (ribokinase family)